VIPLWSVFVLVLGVEAPAPALPPAPVSDPVAASMPAPAIDLTPIKLPPLRVYNVHYAIDVPIIALGATIGLLRGTLGSYMIRKRCPCDPHELNALDRGSVSNHSNAAGIASDITDSAAMAVPPLLDLVAVGFSWALLEDVTIMAETVMVEVALHQFASLGVQRPRPRTYAGETTYVTSPDGYMSFYAGHVGSTVAALSMASYTVRLRYGEHWWPWVITGLVGTSISVERVANGAHFPTDVIAGAAVGFAVGIGVPWLHAKKPDLQMSIVPGPGDAGLGLAGMFD
jgi:membrane-associated phospholipid phosphatase